MTTLNVLPQRVDGWLIRGEGCELALAAVQPWESTPTLRLLLPTPLAIEATVDGDTAVWSLTVAQVEAAVQAAPPSRGIAHHVTVGIGESLRTVAAGVLTWVDQDTGDPQRGQFAPVRIVVGPPGLGADPETIGVMVADWLAAHPSAALADHIAAATPHPAYDSDLPSLQLIFENHLI